MIEGYLSKAKATELFEQECMVQHGYDAVPEYRIAELFGIWTAQWIEEHIGADGHLIPGRDWNGSGSCEPDSPFLRYFYLSGFLKIVSAHNRRLHVEAHTSSEAGKAIDAIWEERSSRLEEKEAEEEARREERRRKARERRKAKENTQDA